MLYKNNTALLGVLLRILATPNRPGRVPDFFFHPSVTKNSDGYTSGNHADHHA